MESIPLGDVYLYNGIFILGGLYIQVVFRACLTFVLGNRKCVLLLAAVSANVIMGGIQWGNPFMGDSMLQKKDDLKSVGCLEKYSAVYSVLISTHVLQITLSFVYCFVPVVLFFTFQGCHSVSWLWASSACSGVLYKPM